MTVRICYFVPFVVLGYFDDIYFYKRSLGARLQNERVSAMKIYTSQSSLVRNLVRLHILIRNSVNLKDMLLECYLTTRENIFGLI